MQCINSYLNFLAGLSNIFCLANEEEQPETEADKRYIINKVLEEK